MKLSKFDNPIRHQNGNDFKSLTHIKRFQTTDTFEGKILINKMEQENLSERKVCSGHKIRGHFFCISSYSFAITYSSNIFMCKIVNIFLSIS